MGFILFEEGCDKEELFMGVLAAFIFILFSMFPCSALSDLIVYDMVISKGKDTMLKVKTKGRFFSKGGVIVEFFVDGKSIGKSLSGSDGFAFRQFTPLKTGLYRIAAKAEGEKDSGLLLALNRGTGIIFVDVEGSLFELFSKEPKHGSQKAIKEIYRRFPVVFLQTGFLDIKSLKTWLKKNGFKELPIVSWKGGAIFDEIYEEGLRIKAIIGSPHVISSAEGYKPLAFSFDNVEGAIVVKDWEEIIRKLRQKYPTD